jgi:hypothetical protein
MGIVATDERVPVSAPTSPPPISGGTLLVTHDGRFAVAADPDRDRVSIVSVQDRMLLHTIAMNPGDEPGRVVEDTWGMVHVALRRGGAVATIDPVQGTLLRRAAVCGAPRGVAYERATKLVHVACAGGELVSLPATGGDAVRRLNLGPDLRDVVVTPTGLAVSRFKSASLISLDPDGNVIADVAPQRVGMQNPLAASMPGSPLPAGQPDMVGIDPAVAWRTVTAPSGDVVFLHQYGLAAPIGPSASPTAPSTNAYYGTPMGSPQGCGGLVSAGVSSVSTDGRVSMGAQVSGAPLTVDMSVSPDGAWVALAHAGTVDPGIFDPSSGFAGFLSSGGQVSIQSAGSTAGLPPNTSNCTTPEMSLAIAGQVTAVAFNPNRDSNVSHRQGAWLVVQSREPAQLIFIRDESSQEQVTADLGGPSMLDTGHEIFHRDSGSGIACAQCHAEGGDDGRVWKFTLTGSRRTQALHIGLAGTEPFHWDGDMSDLSALMETVFVGRMSGPKQAPARERALDGWLAGLKPPAAIGDAASPRAALGKALFESAAVGCNSCHSGDKLTNNANVFVGTTEPGHLVQVPSLVGIGYRGPFLHDGCAATLRDRFDPKCGGGDLHGNTSRLTDEELDNLVAYLETL